jgi:hypothetical protein
LKRDTISAMARRANLTEGARALCARREVEQPQFRCRPATSADDWIVARLPRRRIDRRANVRADRGAPIAPVDVPQPANFRNVPPFGGGN